MMRGKYILFAAASAAILTHSPTIKGPSSAEAVELKLAHFTSPRHPMDRKIFTPWGKELEKLSNGRLTVRIFPGGELGKGPQKHDKRAVDGIADVAWGLQGYTSKQFPRTLLIETPGLASDAPMATKKLWNAFDLIKDDYKQSKIIGLWTSDKLILMMRKDPVTKLEDLKGLKIRIPSRPMGQVVKALGGVPVAIPGPKMYQSLSTGVVEGVISGASVIRSIKLGEVARHYTVGPFPQTAMFLAMNRKTYDGLPADLRALVDKTTGRSLSLKAAETYKAAGQRSLQGEIKSGRGQVVNLSPAEDKRWRQAISGLREANVAALEKRGIPARKILAAMEAGK